MKKIFSLLLSVALLCGFCIPASAAEYRTFPDVPSNHWAAYYIERANELGIMKGYSDGRFYPENTLTRAEMALILYNMSPEFRNNEVTPLVPWQVRDVDNNAWYAKAVGWLYGEMQEGGNDCYGFRNPQNLYDLNNMQFRPNEYARRDYVVNTIRCLAGNYGYHFYDDSYAQIFKDYNKMSGFLAYSVSFAVERGIIDGYPDGTFSGSGTLTRAQAAKIFLAYYDNIMGQIYPNNIDGDYLYINNQTIGLFRTDRTSSDTGTCVALYGDRFIYGRNSDSVLACLNDLPEQMVFTTNVGGNRQNYYVVRKVLFEKTDLYDRHGNEKQTCKNIYNAFYDGMQYDLAIMTYAGRNATQRLVVFANMCY